MEGVLILAFMYSFAKMPASEVLSFPFMSCSFWSFSSGSSVPELHVFHFVLRSVWRWVHLVKLLISKLMEIEEVNERKGWHWEWLEEIGHFEIFNNPIGYVEIPEKMVWNHKFLRVYNGLFHCKLSCGVCPLFRL